MGKNLIKIISETILAGAFLFGNSFTVYAPHSNPPPTEISAPIPEKIYRKLSDSKGLRDITSKKRPKSVKKVYREIVEYAGEVDTLYIPEYSSKLVSQNMCARYSRFSSEDVFNLDYAYDKDVLPKKRGAWNLKYYNKIIASSEEGFSKEELKKLSDENVLQPGMMILLYNKKSKYRNWKDKTGKKVAITHSTNYIGNNPSTGNLRIMNQLNKSSKPLDLNYFIDEGWLVKEILDIPEPEKKDSIEQEIKNPVFKEREDDELTKLDIKPLTNIYK
jgi:hypothetical protein